MELALRYGGEIVSADSRQVFRGLDLGSGKITPEETRGVRHHLIDVCEAGDFFSMADFQRMAYEAIDGIVARGKPPFLVGGTGLYVDSVADGYELSDRMPDLAYRAELEKRTTEELYAMLLKAVPDVEVERRNRNRVMRLLEKLHDGDDVVPGRSPRYQTLRLGVTWDRDTLRRRIDERLDRRLAEGMVEEVRGLLQRGVSEEFLLKLGLEYRFNHAVPDRADCHASGDARPALHGHQAVCQTADDLVPARRKHSLAGHDGRSHRAGMHAHRRLSCRGGSGRLNGFGQAEKN